jgi:AcrR family transcriptional regulator
MSTKDRIIEVAITMFNTHNYDTINLADLAEYMGISRGNLAYHFKEKGLILSAIADQLQHDIDESMKLRRDFPAFSNLQIDIKSYHKLQQTYKFIFSNQTVLHHEAVKKVMHDWSERTIQNNLVAFAYAVENGNMEKEPLPGLYYHLAVNTWMITYFWLSQKTVRNDTSEQDAEKMVWSTIIPHFTPKGIELFEKYFGESSSQNLGKPFGTYTESLLRF